MTINYPAGLPAPLQETSGFESVNNITRTELQSGRARQRVNFTSVPVYATLSWLFSKPNHAALFDSWAAQVAKAGWFRLKLYCATGLVEHDVRFTEAVQGPQRSGPTFWRYTARVELRERPLLAPGWAEIAPDYVLMADIFDRAMNFEWPEWGMYTYRSVFDLAINQEWPQP